jgi:ADP-ribose pyrophosphatase
MANIARLFNDYKTHKKSRTEKHSSYPARFFVPDDRVSWQTEFPNYSPLEYNAPIVLDLNTPWADPQDIRKVNRPFISFEGEVKFNSNGLPINPFGRTGLAGRGVLGKWGANFAVDGIVTTIHPGTNSFRVLTIIRGDTGETAFPGGMVDLNETPLETRDRELAEELSITREDLSAPLYEKIVYKGYVDDPRNTDNAWMETSVVHTLLPYETAQNMILSAGDDAKEFNWVDVTQDNIGHFYANHGYSLLIALNELLKSECTFLNDTIRSSTHKLLGKFDFS